MYTLNTKEQSNKAESSPKRMYNNAPSLPFADQREEASLASKMQLLTSQSKGVQKVGQMKAMLHNSTQKSVQRKIFIEDNPYLYKEDTQTISNIHNAEDSVAPADKAKAKEFSSDPWKRYYSNADQFNKHISNKPVKVGLLKSMALWYKLPFKPGKPFVLAENHATKISPIMKESNRKGTILHESNGVIPIASKEMAKKGKGDGDYNKTAMESVLAKTLFGVEFHPAISMKPKKIKHKTQDATAWINSYGTTDSSKTGKDEHGRPYYTNEEGVNVIQEGGNYNSIDTLRRVKVQFDQEADSYIEKGKNETAKVKLGATKTKLDTWLTQMNELADAYKEDETDDIERLTNSTNVLRTEIISNLKALFKLEYSNKKEDYLEERKKAVRPVFKKNKLDESLDESMAMRDLAMLNIITTTKNWGDHEIIAMGTLHVETQKDELSKAGLEVITREEFIKNSKPAL